jgi:selenide,water dikinase
MTDVTGFGLLGHLVEMAEGSGLSATINFEKVPVIIETIKDYVDQKSVPGGTHRNWDSYGEKIGAISDYQKAILADPQTSGGLLIAVEKDAVADVQEMLQQNGLGKYITPIGKMIAKEEKIISIIETGI